MVVDQISVRIDPDIKRRMDRLRGVGGRTIQTYVEQALRAQIEREEERFKDMLPLLDTVREERGA